MEEQEIDTMNISPKQHFLTAGHYGGLWDLYADDVNKNSSGNIYKFTYDGISIDDEHHVVLDRIVGVLETLSAKVRVKYLNSSEHAVIVSRGSAATAIKVFIPEKHSYQNVNFTIVGERELGMAALERIRGIFSACTKGTIKWFRKCDNNRTESSTIVIEDQRAIYSEFYPWIKGGVENYLDRFMASDSSILLMIGPPGTGKTSLLRYLISSRNLTANITYDEELLSSDDLFYTFITGKSELLVIEDADNLICSRDSGNRLIPRFLNTAEGLVKVGKKKMIFTTNLETVNNVDEALVRPGRCFDVMKTRALTHDEMVAATAAAGISYVIPRKEEYTISEIFSSSRPGLGAIRKIGF